MINQKKFLTIFSILAVSMAARAEDPEYLRRMYMPPNIKGDIHQGLSADWNAGATLSMDVANISDGFDSLGDNINLTNMRLSADVLYSIFGLRATLQDNYEGSFKISDSDIQKKLREFYVGVNISKNVIVIFGRMDNPIVNQVTQRSMQIDDPIARLNLDDQRYLVGTVQITPELSGALHDLSVEISAFSEKRQTHLTTNAVKDMKSFAVKVKKIIGPVFAQATYTKPNSGGYQADGSIQVAPIGGFTPYAQGRLIRKDPTYGDTDVMTIGVSTLVWGDKNTLYLEGSRIKTRNSNVLARQTQNNATLGLRHALNDYVDVFGEYTTNVATPAGSVKDSSVWVGARVHGKDESTQGSPLFSGLKKK